MPNEPLRLLIIGAHPDDADYHAGGTAALYRRLGHEVKMVSLTNGDAGHHEISGRPLADRRRREAAASGAVIGATYDVWNHHDAELLPTLDLRRQIIRQIRTFRPDLVLTHRPNDYHPDHRYTSQAVQDAAYLVTVPAVVPEVPHLARDPVIAYLPDQFQKPRPFEPTVAVIVDDVVDQVVAMLACHESQFFEWLPYNTQTLAQVPAGLSERREWFGRQVKDRLRQQAERFRGLLVEQHGPERGRQAAFAEAFEGCEYGAPLDAAARARLFPFSEKQ